MSLQLSIQLGAAIALGVIIVLVAARRRLGALNAASWLVIWGAIILATEHPLFAIAFSLPLEGITDELRTPPISLLPHARTHFFMAGIYTIVGQSFLFVESCFSVMRIKEVSDDRFLFGFSRSPGIYHGDRGPGFMAKKASLQSEC